MPAGTEQSSGQPEVGEAGSFDRWVSDSGEQQSGEDDKSLRHARDRGLDCQDACPEVGAPTLDGDELTAVAEKYLHSLSAQAEGAVRATDKMPYNFLNLGLIALLFPKAKILHCRRDPLDSCLSAFFQNFTRGNLQTFDLRNLGHYHRQ